MKNSLHVTRDVALRDQIACGGGLVLCVSFNIRGIHHVWHIAQSVEKRCWRDHVCHRRHVNGDMGQPLVLLFSEARSEPKVWQKFTCTGTIFSGIAIGIIGMLFGSIGREAKKADHAIDVVTPDGVAPAGIDPLRTPVAAGTVAPPTAVPVSVTPATIVRRVTVPVERPPAEVR